MWNLLAGVDNRNRCVLDLVGVHDPQHKERDEGKTQGNRGGKETDQHPGDQVEVELLVRDALAVKQGIEFFGKPAHGREVPVVTPAGDKAV